MLPLVLHALAEDPQWVIPTKEDVIQICSNIEPAEKSCEVEELKRQCLLEKAKFEDVLAQQSDQLYKASYDMTKEEARRRWTCSVSLIVDENNYCKVQPVFSLSRLPLVDSDNSRDLSWLETVPAYFLPEQKALSAFGFDMATVQPDNFNRGITEMAFCPLDTNNDGVISRRDDLNSDGEIDKKDRRLSR